MDTMTKLTTAVSAAVALVACTPMTRAPDMADAIRAPSAEIFAFETRAMGVQIYECATDAANGNRAVWVFKAPEAELYDRAGRKIGKHYGGPTWEAFDGSTVAGVVKGRQDAPRAEAIPWLLLSATKTTGQGRFAATSSIQRIDTAGGTAPARPCTPAMLGVQQRVPYTATYYFYRAPQASM